MISPIAPRFLLLQCLAFAVITGVRCSPEHQPGAQSTEEIQKKAQINNLLNSPEQIDFQVINKFVLKENCAKCHNATRKESNIDLSSYELIATNKSDKQSVYPFEPQRSSLFTTLKASGQLKMPPIEEKPLSKIQIELVQLWIENGANFEKSKPRTERPPTLKEELAVYFKKPENIDYSVVKKYIFKPKCMKCHSLNGEDPNLNAIRYSANLTDYASIFSGFEPTVKPGSHTDSDLYQSTAINQTMPPQQDGYELLSPYLNQLMRLWILNCAIEDKSALKDEVLLPFNPDSPNKRRLCENQKT